MIFSHQKHEVTMKKKEVAITKKKKELVKSMDSDIDKLDELSEILRNGITLQIIVGMRGHK